MTIEDETIDFDSYYNYYYGSQCSYYFGDSKKNGSITYDKGYYDYCYGEYYDFKPC